jgi:hypothetical protein
MFIKIQGTVFNTELINRFYVTDDNNQFRLTIVTNQTDYLTFLNQSERNAIFEKLCDALEVKKYSVAAPEVKVDE